MNTAFISNRGLISSYMEQIMKIQTLKGDESESIQIIVDAIFKKLHSPHSIANEKLVGMETRISDVLSSLDISAEDVRMIGIKGMGGGGKTTLARAVYDRISDHFEGKSFVENVREVSKHSLSGLKKLQKRILKDVLNKTDINLSSVHDERDMLMATMRRRKMYMVEWKDAIDRLKRIPLKDTLKKLKLSYKSLEDDYKEMFLDIACILKGSSKKDAIRILESCGFHAINGLKVLEQRSLITISCKYGELDEIEYILANDMGTEETRCDVKCRVDISQYFSNSLKYLKCTHYPFLYLPKTFQANNLVGLEMKDTERPMVQLWKEGEKTVLNKLKFVSLSRTSHKFKWFSEDYSLNDVPNGSYIPRPKLNYIDISRSELRAFDLGLTPNIETLSLRYSPNLGELCMPVSCEKLKHLVISESKLRTFSLGLTPNLQTLSLFDCADFVELHASVACPNLKFLDICGSSLRSLDLELIPNLERLVLENCNELAEINAPVGCLKKVGYLKLNCLRYIDFEFGGGCEPKVGRPSASLDLVGTSPDLCPLHPSNLKKFSDMICSLCCLKKLKLKCNIPEFPKDLGRLECLEELVLSSMKIKHLPDSICMLKHLKSLTVEYGDLLEKLPEDLGRLECLEKLHVRSKKIEYLPDSICMLKHLKYLDLNFCALLEKLPEDLGRLECLEELAITNTGISHLPQSIFGLKGLRIIASSELLQLYEFPSEIKTRDVYQNDRLLLALE
ncbi:disease resistance TIR-NBS-LRR class family protein [Tanacetum coccineum]|uniref:Disease resistance TIR-NBS-LRR class family protein n=1 Tax=Tanacetum coccineum TaxID=301880 RepID=A0ABQ5CPN1_9ASTR